MSLSATLAAAREKLQRPPREGERFLDRPYTSVQLLLIASAGLMVFGILMSVSTTIAAASQPDGSGTGGIWTQAMKEGVFIALGVPIFWAAMRTSPRTYRVLAYPIMIVGVISLIAVLVPGIGFGVYGARRWIDLGPLQLQPSEFAKVGVLLWGGDLLARKQQLGTLHHARHLFVPLVPGFAFVAMLVMLEPDLGTTCCYMLILLGLLWMVGMPMRYFAGIVGAVAGAVTLLAVTEPYRLQRLTSFLHPLQHANGDGYHAVESMYALGSGGLFGVGLGEGTSKYWVPNANSDFVFSIIGEELGLAGAVVVLALFALLAYAGMRVARRSADPFVRLVAGAATIWLCGQAVINIGYVTALLPVTGIPLPFISAGGTSLLASFLVLGMLVSFARHEAPAVAAARREDRFGRRSRLQRWMRIPVPRPYQPPKRRPASARQPAAGSSATRTSAARTAAPRTRLVPGDSYRRGSHRARSHIRAPHDARAHAREPRIRPRVGCPASAVARHRHREPAGEKPVTSVSSSAPGARLVVAGGHSAGHIEPTMNFADAVRRIEPAAEITALGTERGLDTVLIPARGYPLELIPPVPLSRHLDKALLQTPGKLRASIQAARAVLQRTRAELVVGFGGYVAMPGYLAARQQGIPFVLHEANARAGVANRFAARLTRYVYTASPAVHLPHATPIGIPLRPAIAHLDRAALRAEARVRFGLDPDAPVLLVTGGSQGAQAINAAVSGAAVALRAAGVQVLHIAGPANTVEVADGTPPYVVVPYVDQMQFAYAAADFVICRSGAMTCAELSAVGLPAAYVPLPLRGGEQRYNAEPIVSAGAAIMIDNAELTTEWIVREVIPRISDPARLASMAQAAASSGNRDADIVLARHALEIVAEARASRTGVA